ncbi:MAG: hypothetical protein QOF76_4363 [Solirubrobacteraceae bacterium]|nr:hypothetical protein [Solirubrobacteraceae bacterium]
MELRPPTRADAEYIVAMLLACDIVDVGWPDYDLDGLLNEWNEPGVVDLAKDGFLAEGVYGLVLGEMGRGWVHPDLRGRGLGAQLAEKLENRARERGLTHIKQQIGRYDHTGMELLRSRGYYESNRFIDFRLPDSAVAGLPAAGDVRAYDPARDAQPMQELLERTVTVAGRRVIPLEIVLQSAPDLHLWRVFDAPGGGLHGAVRAELRPAGFISGAITLIGVDKDARGRGIGQALVGSVSRVLLARGATEIRITLRADQTDAVNLFENLGFAGENYIVEFRLDLDGAPDPAARP